MHEVYVLLCLKLVWAKTNLQVWNMILLGLDLAWGHKFYMIRPRTDPKHKKNLSGNVYNVVKVESWHTARVYTFYSQMYNVVCLINWT